MIKGDWGCALVLVVPALFFTWAASTAWGFKNQISIGIFAVVFWAWALRRLLSDRDLWD